MRSRIDVWDNIVRLPIVLITACAWELALSGDVRVRTLVGRLRGSHRLPTVDNDICLCNVLYDAV